MEDDEPSDLSDLTLEEIEVMLGDLGVEMEPTALRNLATFVQEVGDIEDALDALAAVERHAA